jgi:translation elongation factor EF-G
LEAIEHVEAETQSDAKGKLIQEVKDAVEHALEEEDADTAIEATESLIEMLETELTTLQGDEEEVAEVAE